MAKRFIDQKRLIQLKAMVRGLKLIERSVQASKRRPKKDGILGRQF